MKQRPYFIELRNIQNLLKGPQGLHGWLKTQMDLDKQTLLNMLSALSSERPPGIIAALSGHQCI